VEEREDMGGGREEEGRCESVEVLCEECVIYVMPFDFSIDIVQMLRSRLVGRCSFRLVRPALPQMLHLLPS
jgi:hypothetical protein